jgi:hypothetical protein
MFVIRSIKDKKAMLCSLKAGRLVWWQGKLINEDNNQLREEQTLLPESETHE